jgi:hypothetical protein
MQEGTKEVSGPLLIACLEHFAVDALYDVILCVLHPCMSSSDVVDKCSQ